jgi:RND family efflux transporter MFP subunit
MRERFKNISTKYRVLLVLGILVLIIASLLGISGRIRSYNALKTETKWQAIPTVAIIKAQKGIQFDDIVLPGNVTAWHESTIFARTNGYVKKWFVDIGAHVKKGDLLALIETPEVDAQLRQTDADLKTSVANYELAKSTALRWQKLLKTNSVSQQETNEKISSAKALLANVNSTKANRDRLKELVLFKHIVAPYNGVITSRTTDIGALIDAGSNNAVPLFQIAQSDRLRIYVNIPQYFSSRIEPNMTVTLEFAEHPGKEYPAKLVETANAINTTSRTLLAEFVVNNERYELLPGGYTQVHLKIPSTKGNIHLPVNALLFRAEGLQVATVTADNKILLKSVKILRDFGKEVEISTGLSEGDNVVINPQDSLMTGQAVRVVTGYGVTNTNTSTQKLENKAS